MAALNAFSTWVEDGRLKSITITFILSLQWKHDRKSNNGITLLITSKNRLKPCRSEWPYMLSLSWLLSRSPQTTAINHWYCLKSSPHTRPSQPCKCRYITKNLPKSSSLSRNTCPLTIFTEVRLYKPLLLRKFKKNPDKAPLNLYVSCVFLFLMVPYHLYIDSVQLVLYVPRHGSVLRSTLNVSYTSYYMMTFLYYTDLMKRSAGLRCPRQAQNWFIETSYRVSNARFAALY